MLEIGVGLRKDHYDFIFENRPKVSWFEAISENFMGIKEGVGGRPLWVLEQIRKDYPVVLHGVSLSIGSADSLNMDYLQKLRELYHRIQPSLVSDHLCWTGVEGRNLHDLLPVPFTQEALEHIIEKVEKVQDFLDRQFLLENASSYVTFNHSEMTEWDFLKAISDKTGCGILLDINNIYVSSKNHGFDPIQYINGIPKKAVKQFHLAGHSDKGDFLFDTHDHPVCDDVWELYRFAVNRFPNIPTLIEWDDKIPPFHELMMEAKKAERIWKTP